ncbi:hypothetical protein DICPUDRAFT_147676 [Dictyostelium purpureum]|uniref:Superoxide-generating NADPH oxidase light chain subunit n=1 Tax=Dictyostelium purpureum TaxID=5786 RepID=F0Z942_DICPU|nr:uncharacterized protein DICPUDRAFT_147676 [Dictyostelium purpureum]EGC39489.1 hypothetical protein DICPUDRAFT_147676 [Dictyostelium purpureum]|eukprot:XP_003283936.1 hypothetical protein DICPUDRAFT_147676 [Dictyostelium purpureum]
MLGVGGTATKAVASSFLPESKLLKKIAYWTSVASGGLLIVLGILIIFFSRWILGPFDIACGAVVIAIELFAIRLKGFPIFVTIFDYKIRGPLYVLFCIPAFFSVFTIAPALGCIVGGGIYAILGWVKNEKAEMPEEGNYEKQRDVEGGQENSRL